MNKTKKETFLSDYKMILFPVAVTFHVVQFSVVK